MWFQKEIVLKAHRRGFHLITGEILSALPELRKISTGLCHLFLHHTSAGLTLNENADPSVRADFETFFDHLAPESFHGFTHTLEGADDMPAHLKTSLVGNSVTIPVTDGRFNLGTWQGVYLCEYRNHGGTRSLVATVNGE